MGTSQNQRIDAALLKTFEIYFGSHFDHLIVGPAFLYQRNKERTGSAVDFHASIGRFQRMSIGAALYRRFGADDTDFFVFGATDRAPHSGFDYADDRHGKANF